MKSFKVWIAGVLLLTSVTAGAANTVVTVDAQGNGLTEREAIDDALARASGKVNGASVSVDSSVSRQKLDISARSSYGESVRGTATYEESKSAGYEAQGQVQDYDVLSTKKVGDGYRVTVRAKVVRYVAPGQDSKRYRIAIFPVTYRAPRYSFYGDISGEELAGQIADELESKIISSRLFSVLDRASMDASLAELALVGSDLTSPAEKAKLQRMDGADYIVVSTIRKATDRDQAGVNPATGQSAGKYRFELEVRVIVPATGELVASEVYSVPASRDRQAALDLMGSTAVTGLVGQIYPGRETSVRKPTVTEVQQAAPATTGVRLPFD